jgi:hypothetical protein
LEGLYHSIGELWGKELLTYGVFPFQGFCDKMMRFLVAGKICDKMLVSVANEILLGEQMLLWAAIFASF